MKKSFLLSFLFLVPSFVQATRSPEVLHLDKNSPERFLVSNSGQEAIVELKGEGKGTLDCNGKIKEVSLKKNITIAKDIESCELTFNDKKIRLVKDETAFPLLKDFHGKKESCEYKSAQGLEGLFLTNNYPMMSCAHSSNEIEILDKSEDGLLSKMEALLGYKPGVEFLSNGNPYAELDFSKAPKLDAIFISTLLYRRDFTGTVIGRLLKFHAERGAIVNIIGTGYMQDEKDKSLLKELAQVTNGNIRIQEYKFIDPKGPIKTPGAYLTNYLRDFHVKMFVTLSSNPKDNVVITGGRNIHDGFHFAEKPDFSKYPEIQQSPEGAYAYWNDLEIKITSESVARSAYGHLLKFWNRKVKGQVTEDISELTKTADAQEVLNSNETMMRHILSLPFNDNSALEKLYVEMIDKAENTIRLSSPYLRPTKAIMNAFKRAIARNVQITIQTRINLAGDTQAWLYEETNKAAINDLYEHVRLYEWTENSILHTKMMIIDEKFAFFGSVNLSRRSFIQDVESGYIIHDENFVGRLVNVFDGYKAKSRVIDQKQKRKFWASIFVQIFQNQF